MTTIDSGMEILSASTLASHSRSTPRAPIVILTQSRPRYLGSALRLSAYAPMPASIEFDVSDTRWSSDKAHHLREILRFIGVLNQSTPTASTASWLREALADLDEIAAGVEVDGPTPDDNVIAASRAFLETLSHRVSTVAGIDDDGLGGVGVEFIGRNRDRVLFVVEHDLSASYHEYINGEASSTRHGDWQEMLTAIGDSWLRRAKMNALSPSRPGWILTNNRHINPSWDQPVWISPWPQAMR